MGSQRFEFYVERLTNNAWVVGWLRGGNDYGRVPAERAAFPAYNEAEQFALGKLKEMLRKQRDDWTAK